MMTMDAIHRTRARQRIRDRVAGLSLVAIGLLTSLVWNAAAWGQVDVRRVGILSLSAVTYDPRWEASLKIFRRALANHDWIEGTNVSFEYRSAGSDPSHFATAAAELVALNVDVILAASAPALRATYAATRTIPIVGWDYTTDPVAEGYVESYARPGGNVTGIFLDAPEFAGKWFELLTAIVPGLSRVSVFWDPAPGATHLQAVRSVAESLNIRLQVFEVHKPDDIDTAFAAFRSRAQALIILPSPMNHQQSARLAALALEHRLPATSMALAFANAGGVIAYGPEFTSTIERSAAQVAKILNGVNPAEIPVERPAKIHLLVNLKTANALGITIPQSILLRADEVIR